MNDVDNSAGQTPANGCYLETPSAAILASLGFACLTAWGVCLVFAPALPLLSYLDLNEAIACLLASCAFGMAALGVGIKLSRKIIDHARGLLFPGMLIIYGPLAIVGIISWVAPSPVPAPAAFAAWMLGSLGWIVPSAQWMIIYSNMPAKWSALSIASGGLMATPLFFIVGSIGIPAVAVIAATLQVFASGALAYFLLTRIDPSTYEEIKQRKNEHRKALTALKASGTVAAHGMSYGFIVIMISSLGLGAILIAGSMGLASSLIALLWARRRTRSNWTTESAQRVAVPLVVAALLLIPFCGDAGKIVCGSVSIATFAYVTLMEWTGQVVKNAEFQLFPLQRFALGRLAQWFGFLVGALIAFVMFFHPELSPLPLTVVIAIMVIIIVAAYAIYDGIASKERDPFFDIVLGDPTSLVIDPPKNAAPFRERCDTLIEKFQLSAREAEVFRYLAKGRNADYIQQKLFISANTVKTHISHIYKKMGINNQQWLIDLVDQREHRDEDTPPPSNRGTSKVESERET